MNDSKVGDVSVYAQTVIETIFGNLSVSLFRGGNDESCLLIQSQTCPEVPYVRIHSACLFGESLHSKHCDCREQLDSALSLIAKNGGVIVYLNQEGRGEGLEAKMRAMDMERRMGLTTVEAYSSLGLPADARSYDMAIQALIHLGLKGSIRLITNNPSKIAAMESAGFEVLERIEPELHVSQSTAREIVKKQSALGHIKYSNLVVTESHAPPG